MSQESTGSIILSPVLITTGDPAGRALENWNTNVLANGSLCYVEGGAGQGEWQLQKEATDAPDGVTIVQPISGPGRWFLKILPGVGGGGGGGGINVIQGADGITVTNPMGPTATVSGANLLPLDGSRAMTGDIDMGGNAIANASDGDFSGSVTATDFNGVPLTDGGVGTLYLADDGTYKAVPAAVPGGVDRDIQFNNAGAFGGSAEMKFLSGATHRTIQMTSPAANADQVGVVFRNSLLVNRGEVGYDNDTDTVYLEGDANTFVGGSTLQFNGGTDDLLWPAADGTAGQVLTTDGSGVLSFTDPASGGGSITMVVSAATSPNLGADPGANSMATWLLTAAAARDFTLPSVAADGARINVKNAANSAAPITVVVDGGANIDFSPSYNIATIGGSATFQYEASTNQWWVI